MKPHEKIISQTAKEILAPLGFFRKGSSRTYVQDNGWFLSVIEYRHHYYFQGAEVYVRMEALWDAPGVDFLTPITRMVSYKRVDYKGNDEEFAAKILEITEAAKQNVLEYKKYCDIEYAKKNLTAQIDYRSAGCWVNWKKAMLAYFWDDIESGDEYLKGVYQYYYDMELQSGVTEEQARDACEEYPLIQAYYNWAKMPADKKHNQVLQDIKATRQELRTQSAWKKLREDDIYG